MFPLCGNRPPLPAVAGGLPGLRPWTPAAAPAGRFAPRRAAGTHAAPFGAGENPGQPAPAAFLPAPRGAGVCSSAIRDREGAGADLPHPRP